MLKNALYVLGAVFILIGLLGFVNHPILGLFQVNTVHNIVHLLSGILAIVFAGMGESQARTFAIAFGVVYGLVAVLGLLTGSFIGLFAVNGADNVLHILLTIVFLGLGLTGKSTARPVATV